MASWECRADDAVRSGPIVVSAEAEALHRSCLVIDGHNDLPWAMRENAGSSFTTRDISQSQPAMHTDIPRLRAGGVGAQFWSVFVPASTGHDGSALRTTLEQMRLVRDMVARYPGTFALAMSADDIERIHKEGKIASLMGVEGGHSIEDSVNVLRQLYTEGARYMTLTHSETLAWADSATDDPKHDGLTAFGEEIVRQMNALGMLVDISHVSVATMHDVLEITTAPVIFSHSSARAIADHPRNVPDDVLGRLPKNGGLVMVNYYPEFVGRDAARRGVERMARRKQLEAELKDDNLVRAEMAKWETVHPLPRVTIYDVLDHIDHIVQVAGVDHVGIGSDFDGVDALPEQLEDVATYPRITQGLLDRGYSADQIRKILGLNLLRALRGAEAVRKS